mmetsp:Transcript_11520/g.26146  ORF Transcript_11520/g.26146 Transcript_11520/m.26146 type:complete len:125 (+) Transcript_11520:36-410(+)
MGAAQNPCCSRDVAEGGDIVDTGPRQAPVDSVNQGAAVVTQHAPPARDDHTGRYFQLLAEIEEAVRSNNKANVEAKYLALCAFMRQLPQDQKQRLNNANPEWPRNRRQALEADTSRILGLPRTS